MGLISDQWTKPRRARDYFPPYSLADRDVVAATEDKTRKLARIYHVAHDQAWNGRAVLKELVDKHGGVHVPEDKKESLGRVASILLWGELAAWSISADIALKLEDIDAKMAASSQVFDEARHFYVLRDYLWQAGIELPPLTGYSHRLLVSLLETDNLLYKLVGMQLMVENTAVCLFKMIAKAKIEPVLTDLLYYYERDEARHVGLGVLALPHILADLGRVESLKLYLFQTRISLFLLAGGLTMRHAFADLGVDQSEMQRMGFRLQAEVVGQMRRSFRGEDGKTGAQGLFKVSRNGQRRMNTFLFPKVPAEELPVWHSSALRTLIWAAETGDRWLRV
jgi:hypothetical protein